MIHLLFMLLYLARVVQGTTTNSTSSSFPQPAGDGTTRSVWSILGSCALTLLICVWHSIHFDLPTAQADSYMESVGLILASFFAPEIVVMVAGGQWWKARGKVIQFREKGYKWSMTHSFFAEMGGFVYRDDKGSLRTVNSLEFLELCKANKIANPLITTKEIKDKSKSDALGKAILVLQLLWFTLQVVVRGSRGLAVTLVELDTVSMAALALLVLCFWWEKPQRPVCPHIFYSPQDIRVDPQTDSILRNAWRSEPSYLYTLVASFVRTRKTRSLIDEEETALVGTHEKPVHSESGRPLAKTLDENDVGFPSFFATWTILGALHLIAWNFDFPTETEKILWRVASLVLAGGPPLSLLYLLPSALVWGRTTARLKMSLLDSGQVH